MSDHELMMMVIVTTEKMHVSSKFTNFMIFFFFLEFHLMTSVTDNNSLSLDQDTN